MTWDTHDKKNISRPEHTKFKMVEKFCLIRTTTILSENLKGDPR
jgi:hypothetical protein